MPGGVPWSKEESKVLFDGIGAYGLEWFCQRTETGYEWAGAPLQRSANAIYSKLYRLYGKGGLTRGVRTLREVLEYSGYSRTHVLRAQKALHQKWRRTGPGGSYLISDEQMDEILDWLQHDYWSKIHRLYCCLGCTGDRRPHRAVGLCSSCYYQYRRVCEKLDLPSSIKELKRITGVVSGQELEGSALDGKILEEAIGRLRKGVVPEPWQLEWLAVRYCS
jgi:hypothetical protein